MTSRRIDQFLLALGMALIFISSYQLFMWRLEGEKEGFSLGILAEARSVVKVKNFSALDWKDAYSGAGVTENQLIYTDEDSSVDVKFQQGHNVTISENSLVKISSIGTDSEMNVERGFIRARLNKDQPLFINVQGSELKLSGENADVQISTQGEKTEIGVLSGEVSVDKGGKVERIDTSHSLKVSPTSIDKLEVAYTQIKPLQDEILYTLDDFQSAIFNWEPRTRAEILVSEDPAFKKAVSLSGEGAAETRLGPGTFYWKVESEVGSSLTRSFRIVRDRAPVIIRPLHQEKLTLAQDEKNPTEVFLQWRATPGEDYKLEWFDTSLHEKIVKASGLMIPVTTNGLLKWRIKTHAPDRPDSPWSEMQEIEVTLISPPSVPNNLFPEELELQSYNQDEHEVELSWLSKSKVELELIQPKNEKKLVKLTGSNHLLKIKEPGLYRWRLRSVDEFLRVSAWSEWKSFTLEDLSGEISADKIQRIQLKKPDQLVTFNWAADAGEHSVFELAESKEFKTIIITKEVTADQVSISIPKTGSYYWRSRQYRKDGTFEVSEPKKVLIEAAPAPVKPEKLPDMEVPIKWQETSSGIRNKWWSFILSEAFADDLRGEVIITLPVHDEARQYAVKIYSDPEAQELVYEGTTQTNTFKWAQARPGRYFWHYALIDYWQRKSPYSDLSSLHVTGSAPVLPEKPKLLSPIRAVEVDARQIEVKWTASEKNKKYELQVAQDEKFEKILIKKIVTDNHALIQGDDLAPALYYWRIKAKNNSPFETLSNTGRFKVTQTTRKIKFNDKKESWEKKFSHRFSFAWAPSSDTYRFKGEDKTGDISGLTMNSVEARLLYFTQHYLFSADFLRQSGKVFEDESYLFQRFQVQGTWKKKIGQHLWGPGLSVGSVSGHTYKIKNDEVLGSPVSGLVYGPHVQLLYALNPKWEIQGRATYMLGAIPHMEISTEMNRQMKNYFVLFGLTYSLRNYSEGDGSQNSLRLNLGLGKEF